jgi:hypothetical protein
LRRALQVKPSVERATVMRAVAVRGLFAFLALSGVACGGAWEDDPSNWSRAFGSEKPANYVVSHSKYWRSAHWSYEFEYFFQVKANDTFKQELFTRNQLKQLPAADVAQAIRDTFGASPSWFCPKGADAYDAWVYKTPKRNFRVLIDKKSGDIFLRDYQV